MLAEQRIAGILPHGRAMRSQAIVAAVLRRHRDRDHLALKFREAGVAQHQVVVHRGERFQLRHVEGVGKQHVRHETEFLLAFLEIGSHRRRQLRPFEIERDDRRIVGRRPDASWQDRACLTVPLRQRLCPLLWCAAQADRSLAWRQRHAAVLTAALLTCCNLSGIFHLGLGHFQSFEFPSVRQKTTLFRVAAIRPAGQHFVFTFRELNAARATLSTPVTDASPNGVLLSTFPGRR